MEEDFTDLLYKILVVGDAGVGKTSIIKKYVNDTFNEHYRTTVGIDFAMKVLKISDNIIARTQFWDIAGQTRFNSVVRAYYKDANGVLLVCDIERTTTLDHVVKWKQDIDDRVTYPGTQFPAPTILLVNKVDLVKEGEHSISDQDLNQFCKENNITAWFKTSAKTGEGIDEAVRKLVQAMMNISSPITEENTEIIDLNDDKPPDHKTETTCCQKM